MEVSRDSLGFPGVPWGSLGFPGVPKGALGSPGEPWGALGEPWDVPRKAPVSPDAFLKRD